MTLDPLADRLLELIEQGSIVRSRLTRSMRGRLATLFHIGALEEQKAGGGRRVVLKDLAALETWIAQEYPSGLAGTGADPALAIAFLSFASIWIRSRTRFNPNDRLPR